MALWDNYVIMQVRIFSPIDGPGENRSYGCALEKDSLRCYTHTPPDLGKHGTRQVSPAHAYLRLYRGDCCRLLLLLPLLLLRLLRRHHRRSSRRRRLTSPPSAAAAAAVAVLLSWPAAVAAPSAPPPCSPAPWGPRSFARPRVPQQHHRHHLRPLLPRHLQLLPCPLLSRRWLLRRRRRR